MLAPFRSLLLMRAALAGLTAGLLVIGGATVALADGPNGGGGSGGATGIATTTAITCASGSVYTGSPIRPCTAVATATDGVTFAVEVSYSNNVGASDVEAHRYAVAEAGFADPSGVYAPSHATTTFVIGKAPTSMKVTCPDAVAYTGAALEPCTAALTSLGTTSSGQAVMYIRNVDPGEAVATAAFYGSDNFLGSSDTARFLIGRATTVTITCTPGSTYSGGERTPCTAAATASDGFSTAVPVTYSDNVNAGTATASATYAGDGSGGHLGSTGSTTFTIAKAAYYVGLSCPPSVPYTGLPLTPCALKVASVGAFGFPTVTYSHNVDVGDHATVTATYAGDANHLGATATGSFEITKAPVVVTVTCPATADFTGAPLTPCTAAVTGAGDLATTVPVTYGGNIYAGTATATATYAGDANHLSGTDSANFQVRGFTLKGYYSPLRMGEPGAPVWNIAQAGSTPLRFEAFLPNGTEITSISTLGAKVAYVTVSCSTGTATGSDVAVTSTGSTALRYAGGQFLQLWRTPQTAGCVRITTTTADHSRLTAYFTLR